MATMKFNNVNTPPTSASPDGTYYVKDADNPDRINIYVVSNGVVKRQEDSKEGLVQLEREMSIKQIEGIVFTNGAYIHKSTGAVSNNVQYCYTDYLDISEAISISGIVNVVLNAGVAFYDENKTFVKGIGTSNTFETAVTIFEEITKNIKYVRFSTLITAKQKFFAKIDTIGKILKADLTGAKNNIKQLQNSVDVLVDFNSLSFDILDEPFVSQFEIAGIGYWTGTAGNQVSINSSTAYRYMALMPCVAGQTIRMWGFVVSASSVMIAVFVDAAGNYINRQNGGANFQNGDYKFIAPANTAQIGFVFQYSGVTGGFPIESARVQIGDYSVKLQESALPESLRGIEMLPAKITSLEHTRNFLYVERKETVHNFNNQGAGYWQGTVGQPVQIVASSGYNRHPIIPISHNDTIQLRGVYAQANTGCIAQIDANGNYLRRFNFNSANPNHDFINGNFLFKNTYTDTKFIGWYADNRNPGTFPLSNARLIINEGLNSLSITPEYKTILEETLQISNDKSMEWLHQMYQRGRAQKIFTKKPCILIWGQSNADGRNVIGDVPAYITALGNILPKAKLNTSVNGSFSIWNQTASWAFKLITAYYLTEIDNRECYFINCTVGGTSMAESGTTTQHWTPFTERLAPGDTSLLRRLETQILTAISLLPNEFDVRAIIGHQGEGDKDEVSATAYYSNLRAFIAYVRGVIGNQYLPFLSGTIPHLSSSYNSVVEAAQLQVMADDYYTHYVDLSQGTMFDGLHFDAQTSEAFGVAVYNKLKEYGL